MLDKIESTKHVREKRIWLQIGHKHGADTS